MNAERAPRRLRSVDTSSVADPSDDELMAKVALGDRDAFAALYDRLAPLVYGIARKVVRDPAQAEEISQEALLDVWRTAPRFDRASGSVRSWAATIAHRRAVDRVRSEQASRERIERDAVREPVTSEPAEGIVLDTLDRERVVQALDQLSEVQRQSIELAYFGGHTYADVSRLLDVPLGTIRTRIRDGLIRLRDTLEVTA